MLEQRAALERFLAEVEKRALRMALLAELGVRWKNLPPEERQKLKECRKKEHHGRLPGGGSPPGR